MRTIIIFENADYIGRPERDFYRKCLKKQPGLLKYIFSLWWAALLRFFHIINEQTYYERSWRYLAQVRDLDERLQSFWAKRLKRRIPIPRGSVPVIISRQPALFLAPLARLRGAELYANDYNLQTCTFTSYDTIPGLYARSGGGDIVYDRLRSELRGICPPEALRPARCGKTFETARQYQRHMILVGLYTFAVILAASIALGTVSLFFATANYGMPMFLSYFHNPVIALLNILPITLVLIFFYFVFNRMWLAFSVTSLLTVIMTLINYFKITFRNDPFIFEDMTLVFEAADMGQQYNVHLNLRIVIYILCCVAGVLFCIFLAKGRLRLPKTRALGALVTLGVMILCFSTVYLDENIYDNVTRNEDLISKWSENQVFFSKGFFYPFIHSIKDNIDLKPDGYDADTAEKALFAHAYYDIPEGEKVNIIAIMLEAYNDFSKFDELEFNMDVYEVLHQLENEGYSGELVTNIFAGGTIDTERCFITGFTELSTFRQYTNSYAWYFREQGYYVTGAHGCYQWFYNRQNINEYLGLEDYKFVENYYSPVSYGNVAPDYIFIPSLIDLYEEYRAQSDAPYFSFNVSYQGHGPYSLEKTTDVEYVVNQGYTDAEYNILNNYFDSIYDTNQHLKELFDYFRVSDEPTVIVIFGDHNPWMGDGGSVYNTLGINFDLSTDEGFYNYFSTPYLIWGNEAAKEATGSSIQGEGGNFSPCFLMNELFDVLGWEGNEFMQVSNELRDHMDVVNTTGIFRADGTLSLELNDEHQQIFDNYKQIEYYWRKNFYYSAK